MACGTFFLKSRCGSRVILRSGERVVNFLKCSSYLLMVVVSLWVRNSSACQILPTLKFGERRGRRSVMSGMPLVSERSIVSTSFQEGKAQSAMTRVLV